MAFATWVAAREPAAPLQAFRVAFAAIWLTYDLCDLLLAGTARCRNWGAFVLGVPHGLQALQLGLIACELLLLRNLRAREALVLACALRLAEAQLFLHANDFWYFTVVAAILAQAPWEAMGRGAAAPTWVRSLVLMETGFIYLATAVLKLGPSWLSGAELHARMGLLVERGWPFPAPVRACALQLSCDAALAWIGLGGEFVLAGLLLSRRGRPLALLAALGVHGMGALATNVWFFGASMLATTYLLMPGRPAADVAR